MSLPSVSITVEDGALGAVDAGNPMLVVIAPATAGALNTPAAYATTRGVVAAYTGGTLVEAASYAIEQLGQPVICIRSTGSTDGAAAHLVKSFAATSTSVPTLDEDAAPDDDYEGYIVFTTGGTIGSAGIKYRTSLDNGRTLGPVQALGTSTSITIGGVPVNFAAGTVAANDYLTFMATGPQDSAADVTAALTALKSNKSLPWELCLIMSQADATMVTAIDTAFVALFGKGKFKDFVVNVRPENVGETQAEYATAMAAIRANANSVWGGVAASAARVPSVLTGRTYRRPVALPYAVKAHSVSHEIDIAAIEGNALPVGILDANGSPDPLYHDENENPGLDDLGFITLRTWEGETGVYVTNPRIFAPDGSDFDMRPLRRVMNLFLSSLNVYFRRRLSKPVRVDKATGFLLPAEASEIRGGAIAACRPVLLDKPKASDLDVIVSTSTNVLSTKRLSATGRLTPLGYPKAIDLTVSFFNPALQIRKV